MAWRGLGSSALVAILSLSTSSCSQGISDETFMGMTVCAKVWALDMSFHQYGSSRDYTDEINALVASANEAVALNTDRYGQLALLVNQFKSAVENRDRRQLLDLVAVEGECENLGFGMNE